MPVFDSSRVRAALHPLLDSAEVLGRFAHSGTLGDLACDAFALSQRSLFGVSLDANESIRVPFVAIRAVHVDRGAGRHVLELLSGARVELSLRSREDVEFIELVSARVESRVLLERFVTLPGGEPCFVRGTFATSSGAIGANISSPTDLGTLTATDYQVVIEQLKDRALREVRPL